MCEELRAPLMEAEPGHANDALFNLFAPFALRHYVKETHAYRCGPN
jgi:hypothetical protein